MNCTTNKNGCTQHNGNAPFQTLEAVVEEFNHYEKKQVDSELAHYSKKKNTYEKMIAKAGNFENNKGKKHPHQHRITHAATKQFNNKLHSLKKEYLEGFETFDSLLNFIDQTFREIPGIGDLVIYDTANRLGFYLGLSPDVVYLHAGTLKGAKKLFGHIDSQKTYLKRSELPDEFSELTADQIESLLCIYKKRLSQKLIPQA